jgi:hypothetical protein
MHLMFFNLMTEFECGWSNDQVAGIASGASSSNNLTPSQAAKSSGKEGCRNAFIKLICKLKKTA